MTDRKVLVLGSDGKIQQIQSGDTPVSGSGSPLGGASATGTGFLHITSGSADAAAKLVETTDFAANVIDTDGTLAANSDTRLATQKATKTYVDAEATARASADTTLQSNIDGKQPIDAELTALAGLTSAANKGIQFTGLGTAATYDLTAAGKAILDDADADAQLATLGGAAPTGTGGLVRKGSPTIDGLLSLSGIEDSITAFVGGGQESATLLDATKTIHRITTSLAVGASVKLPPWASGAFHIVFNRGGLYSTIYASGTDTINEIGTGGIRIWPGSGIAFHAASSGAWETVGYNLDPHNNLADILNAATARANLGLGTGDSPQFTAVNVGHASDTTISRASAGVIAIEGTSLTSLDGTINPNTTIELVDDFIRSAASGGPFNLTLTVSGSGGTNPYIDNAKVTANHQGVVKHDNNGSATGKSGFYGYFIYTNSSNLTMEFCVNVAQLSTVAQEFLYVCGIDDVANATAPGEGIDFVYDRLTYGANWQLRVTSSSTSTVRDTGIAVGADTWVRLKFVVNSAGTSIQAYINGTAAGAAVTTNIPTFNGAVVFAYGYLKKTAGTNTTPVYCDYMYYKYSLSR